MAPIQKIHASLHPWVDVMPTRLPGSPGAILLDRPGWLGRRSNLSQASDQAGAFGR